MKVQYLSGQALPGSGHNMLLFIPKNVEVITNSAAGYLH